MEGPDQTRIGASFQDGRDQCPRTVVAGCTHTHCGIDSLASSYDAGLLELSGSTVHTLSPTHPSTSQVAYDALTMTRDFLDSEVVAISTTGSTVPAFSAALAMPAVATVARPASLVIDRTQPFSFSWTGGGGEVGIVWSFGGTQWIDCRFPVTAGGASVPAEVMALLPSGSGFLDFVTRSEVDVATGPWDVQVYAVESAGWSDGSVADASVTFR